MADVEPTAPLAPPPPAPPARTIPRGRMALLFAVMLTTAAGNTAMQSVMPSIGTSLGVNDVWISLAYSWSALLWVICAPIWAQKSDQRGRKAMMALGMLGFIASFLLCGLMLWLGLAGILPAFWALMLFAAARSLYGWFGSAAPPAVQAYVASRTPRSERTQALSLIASSFGLGTVIGPALAPLMVMPVLGLAGPFLVFALIGLVTLIALRLRLPDDEPQFAARGSAYDAPYSGGPTAEVSKDEDEGDEPAPGKLRWFEPRLRPWVISGLLGGHAQAMILGIAGFLVLDRLGLRGDRLLRPVLGQVCLARRGDPGGWRRVLGHKGRDRPVQQRRSLLLLRRRLLGCCRVLCRLRLRLYLLCFTDLLLLTVVVGVVVGVGGSGAFQS